MGCRGQRQMWELRGLGCIAESNSVHRSQSWAMAIFEIHMWPWHFSEPPRFQDVCANDSVELVVRGRGLTSATYSMCARSTMCILLTIDYVYSMCARWTVFTFAGKKTWLIIRFDFFWSSDVFCNRRKSIMIRESVFNRLIAKRFKLERLTRKPFKWLPHNLHLGRVTVYIRVQSEHKSSHVLGQRVNTKVKRQVLYPCGNMRVSEWAISTLVSK